jgi:Rrf2 family protein
MLTKKSKYGLKAALFLAREAERGPIHGSLIAECEGVPKQFLDQILLELKASGIVTTRRGKTGGYSLGRSPHDISLGEIVRILDGPLAPIPCASETAYARCVDCVDESACGIRRAMKRVRDATSSILDGTTLADVNHQTATALRFANRASEERPIVS